MARCTKIINQNSEDAKYVINVKQIAKVLVSGMKFYFQFLQVDLSFSFLFLNGYVFYTSLFFSSDSIKLP